MKPTIDDELRILSNPLRRKILLLLCDSSFSFTALKTKFKVNPNSLSRQLNRLTSMKLIENDYQKSEGKDYSFYKITDSGLELLGTRVLYPFQMRLLTRFKNIEQQDWVWQFGDAVKADGKYNSFLVMASLDDLRGRNFSLDPVLKVSRARQAYYVDETGRDQVVSISYIAWFLGRYSARLKDVLPYLANELSLTTALYCLSLHRSACFVYNHTDSIVFEKFERFLKDMELTLEPFPEKLVETR